MGKQLGKFVYTFLEHDLIGTMGGLMGTGQRMLTRQIESFNSQLLKIKAELNVSDDFGFKAFNLCKNKVMDYDPINAYPSCMVGSGLVFLDSDQRLMAREDWLLSAGSGLQNTERDVPYRIKHGALLTPVIAKNMGLIRSDSCPFCSVSRPRSDHMVLCESTKGLWTHIRKVLIGVNFQLSDELKVHGIMGSKYEFLNTFIFIAQNVVYARFIYKVNSGKDDFDVINKFNERIRDKIFMQYFIAKANNKMVNFLKFWNNGYGIFKVVGNDIEINLMLIMPV